MSKKIIWLIVSCLMAMSLVMASCGPATVSEEEEEEEVVIGEEEEEEVQEVISSPEKPQYGGTVYLSEIRDITNFANILEFC